MSKSHIIQKFAKAYNGFSFATSVYVMNTLADSLGLIVFFGYVNSSRTEYTFYVNNLGCKGRKVISVILDNGPDRV